jgi:glutamate racemase
VNWLDPAPAIARRVVELLGPQAGEASTTPPRLILTSGRTPSRALAKSLANFGFARRQPSII